MTTRFSGLRHFAGSKAALAIVLAIVTGVFALTRMQYWIDSTFPRFYADSETYLAIAFDIANGVRPLFDLRPPGYPLFLYLVLEWTDSVFAVVLLQQLATLLVAYLVCVASFMMRRSLSLFSLIPALAIVGLQQTRLYELAIMAEALYSDAIVVAFASLFIGFSRHSRNWFLLSSLAMGVAVLLRPSGLFLVGTYLLVLLTMWVYRFGRGAVLNFAAPLPAILLALCTYNYATIGKFTVSPFGPANLAGVTATFAREVPGFPASVNSAILRFQETILPEDRATLRSGWNAWRLSDVYNRHYNKFLWFTVIPALDDIGVKGMTAQVPYLAKLSHHAISQDFPAYAKFVYASLYLLLTGVGRDESDGQRVSYERIYGEGRYLKAGVASGFQSQLRHLDSPDRLASFRRFAMREYDGAPPSNRLLPPLAPHGLAKAIADQPQSFSRSARLANQYNAMVHGPIYVNVVWLVCSPLLILLSVFVLFRFREPRTATLACLGLIVPLSLLGATLMTALVEEGLDRYVYPTRFLFYMAPLLIAAICLEVNSKRRSHWPHDDRKAASAVRKAG